MAMDLLAWETRNRYKLRRLAVSLIGSFREIGLLFLVFGPLDAALAPDRAHDTWQFFVMGVFYFVLALALEWRLDAE